MYDMQIDINNTICKNYYGAMLHYIPPFIEYKEKLVKFSCFEENAGNGQLRDVIQVRGIIDVKQRLDFFN